MRRQHWRRLSRASQPLAPTAALYPPRLSAGAQARVAIGPRRTSAVARGGPGEGPAWFGRAAKPGDHSLNMPCVPSGWCASGQTHLARTRTGKGGSPVPQACQWPGPGSLWALRLAWKAEGQCSPSPGWWMCQWTATTSSSAGRQRASHGPPGARVPKVDFRWGASRGASPLPVAECHPAPAAGPGGRGWSNAPASTLHWHGLAVPGPVARAAGPQPEDRPGGCQVRGDAREPEEPGSCEIHWEIRRSDGKPETVLVVIDVQNGFIRDTTSAPVVELIAAY